LPPEELEDDEDNMFSAIRVFLEKRTRKQVEALAKLEINIFDDDVSGIGELESGTGMYWVTELHCEISPA
jgi:hypothetical protein